MLHQRWLRHRHRCLALRVVPGCVSVTSPWLRRRTVLDQALLLLCETTREIEVGRRSAKAHARQELDLSVALLCRHPLLGASRVVRAQAEQGRA